MRRTWPCTVVTLAGVLVYAGWVLLSRRPIGSGKPARTAAAQTRATAEFLRAYGGEKVRILNFYAPNGNLAEDEHTVICYGVLNAKSVRMEPPLDGVGVSINRCVEDTPRQDTRYTLVAEGHDGSIVSESFVIRTHPDPELLPVISRFQLVRSYDDPGRKVFSLRFETKNAETVAIDPAVFPPLYRAPHGDFYVAPEKTTTYTLLVTDRRGRRVRQKLTVEVH